MFPGYVIDVTLASVATAITDHPQVYQAPTAKRGITIAASKKGTKSFFTVVHGITTVESKKETKTVGFLIISLRQ